MKNVASRMCVSCKQMQDKNTLIKIVKLNDQSFEIEENKSIFGRGAYVCNKKECIEKCIKQKALNRSFKCNVPSLIYDKLKERINIEK